EYRQLGNSGLKVSALSFGTATFAGATDFFKAWGSTEVEEAKTMIRICTEAGINLFDTANTYSQGRSEEVLGEALKGIRNEVLVSTKGTFPMGEGPNDYGSSRHHIIKQCEESLRRLQTDYIDIYHMHGFDGTTPVEETLRTLDDLIQSGKIRYIACSNFSGWHLMKSLAVSERYGWNKYIAHQAYYSLIGREFEWELMPLAVDQKIGTIVWSPLGWGRLTGKLRRGQAMPENTRLKEIPGTGPEVPEDYLYKVVDAIDEIAKETGKTITQVALNWLLQRPTISSIIIGARTEEQLRQNLGAVGWNLTPEQIKRLDAASTQRSVYPYWHQRQNLKLNPIPTT
ncbi:MAG: aldo/keto reductase, partial [Flavisolibacter sp.]|nr:aldo/keto reductase [Flavisolibacter sp.]